MKDDSYVQPTIFYSQEHTEDTSKIDVSELIECINNRPDKEYFDEIIASVKSEKNTYYTMQENEKEFHVFQDENNVEDTSYNVSAILLAFKEGRLNNGNAVECLKYEVDSQLPPSQSQEENNDNQQEFQFRNR